MKTVKLILLLVSAAFVFNSCTKDNYYEEFKEFAPNSELLGEYWVTYYDIDGNELADPSILMVYNTSDASDSIWIDDMENFWQFKVKAKVTDNSFSITEGKDLVWDDNTTITKGKVTDGNIYMELEWASDPGTIYVCKGKRRTGFE